MRAESLGAKLFAVTLIAIGIVGLARGDFAPVWDPVPKGVPAREFLAYLCAAISFISGAGLLWGRSAPAAARLLLATLLLWMLAFRVPVMFRAPLVPVTWEGCGETTVILAAAWILYAGFATHWDRGHFGFATGDKGLRIARVLYGLAMIAFGQAHFAYVKETASLIPNWLPSHVVWVYLTGCTYIAAGLAILIGVCARTAAALSALQMGVFTLLVWIPVVATGTKDWGQWSETIVSWALTTAGWVVADSYRRRPIARTNGVV
jgi:uncharacterized membrane protein